MRKMRRSKKRKISLLLYFIDDCRAAIQWTEEQCKQMCKQREQSIE